MKLTIQNCNSVRVETSNSVTADLVIHIVGFTLLDTTIHIVAFVLAFILAFILQTKQEFSMSSQHIVHKKYS
jgi:hypothetical protein